MKIYHRLVLLFLLFIASIFGSVFLTALFEWDLSVKGMLLLAVALTVAVILIFRLIRGLRTACPQCRKLNAMEDIGREIISSTDTTETVDQPIKDKNNGKITGWYTQTVPAVKYVIDYHQKCRYCGHERTVRKTNY